MNDSEIWKPKPQINNGGEPHTHEGLTTCSRCEELTRERDEARADVRRLREPLEFFVDAIARPADGWEDIRAAMMGTAEQTAWDDAAQALSAVNAREYVKRTGPEGANA